MKNKLKGVTLLETVIYIGLFSLITIMILNFMLTAQESTTRTMRKSLIHQSKEFLLGHIDSTLNSSTYIDKDSSIFNDENGVLQINISGEDKQYTISDSVIYYDSIAITPSSLSVDGFFLEPIYDGDGEAIGVLITTTLRSNGDSSISEDINFLFTLR
ncbi:MAG: hypothetical protein RBT33_03535 [Candidatus Dojkabacteria bacterium]|jgi:hypothetical protein|nr:hypothetical protein [Candidatus Dojkabacteria bacterium]